MLLQILANGAAVAVTLLLAHSNSSEGLWSRKQRLGDTDRYHRVSAPVVTHLERPRVGSPT